MSDFAMKYHIKKKMAMGGAMKCAHGMESGCEMCHGGKMAEGGFVGEEEANYDPMQHPKPMMNEAADDEDDIVARAMKKRMYSEGGRVSNDTSEHADSDPAQFDDLVKDDDLKFSYTDSNSGDELGDKAVDEDDRDVVARAMRARMKKDRMPRPT